MTTEKVVPVTIALPKPYRDLLRRLVLEANMENPDRTVTVSELGREIVCEYLDKLRETRLNHDETGSGKEPE